MENKELSNISPLIVERVLGGEKRQFRFGHRAWKYVQEKYKGLQQYMEASKQADPDMLVELLEVTLVMKETETRPTKEVFEYWLDEFTFGEELMLFREILEAATASLPKPKNPTQNGREEK